MTIFSRSLMRYRTVVVESRLGVHWFALLLLIASITPAGSVSADLIIDAGSSDPSLSPPKISSDGIFFSPLKTSAARNQSLTLAIEAFKGQDRAKCRLHLVAARNQDTSLPHENVMLARMLMGSGGFDESIQMLEQYVKNYPSDPEAYKSFGEIALSTGRFTDAWLQFEKAKLVAKAAPLSETQRKYFDSQLDRLQAVTAEKRGDSETALQLYGELVANAPSEAGLAWHFGRFLIVTGDIQRGYRQLVVARLLETKLPQPELAIATILASGINDEQVEIWYKKGIEAESRTVENYSKYIEWLMQKDQIESAKQVLATVPAKWKGERDIQFLDAVSDCCLGDLESAENTLLAIVEHNGNDLESADQLALVLVESADESKRLRAKQISESNLRQTPTLRRSIATAAWIEFRLGSFEVADGMFGVLTKTGNISSQTAYYIGRIKESRDRKNDAMEFYRLAVDSVGIFPQRRAIRQRLKAADLK